MTNIQDDPDTTSSASTQPSTLDDFTTKMTQLLQQTQLPNQAGVPPYDVAVAPIGIKLNGTNYALWSQVLEMFISGRDKLGYINGDLPEPSKTDPGF